MEFLLFRLVLQRDKLHFNFAFAKAKKNESVTNTILIFTLCL
ncbi:hypothetical protein JCM19298_3381 [Nonlabens ulvanivorans]|nr:hypothetical protein JCM19298_3381 [Nonlabens ulvanivorans]